MESTLNMQRLFDYMENNRKVILEFKSIFLELTDCFLLSPSLEKLLEINQFIHTNNEHIIFKIDSEMWRLKYLFAIMEKEFVNDCHLFCHNCSCHQELFEKLTLCIFSLRRIELGTTEDFRQKGIEWICINRPSPYAVHTICQNEMLVQYDHIYPSVAEIYRNTNSPFYADTLIHLLQSSL